MRRRLILQIVHLAAVVLVLSGTQCHSGPGKPSTLVLVFNQGMAEFTMHGTKVDTGRSERVYVLHGTVDSLLLERNGQNLGILVITSLVAGDVTEDYDAAINVHEALLNQLTLVEQSPYIDCALIDAKGGFLALMEADDEVQVH